MKLKPILVIGVIMLVINGCAHLQQFVKPPQVRILSVTPIAVNPDHIKFTGKLSIENQLPMPMVLDRVGFNVQINGQSMMQGTVNQMPALTAQGTAEVDVPFQIEFEKLYRVVTDIHQKDIISLKLAGDVQVAEKWGMPPLPFNFAMDLPKPNLPRVKIDGLHLLAGKKVGLRLRVQNPNRFDLNITKLDCNLVVDRAPYQLTGLAQKTTVAANREQVMDLVIGDKWQKIASLVSKLMMGRTMKLDVKGQFASDTPLGTMTIPFGGK